MVTIAHSSGSEGGIDLTLKRAKLTLINPNRMPKPPRLVIVFGGLSQLPEEGVCLACGEHMPGWSGPVASSEDIVQWFNAKFDLHVGQRHQLISQGKSNA